MLVTVCVLHRECMLCWGGNFDSIPLIPNSICSNFAVWYVLRFDKQCYVEINEKAHYGMSAKRSSKANSVIVEKLN